MPNDPTNTTETEIVIQPESKFNWLEYRAGYKYQLAKDYTHHIPIFGYEIDAEFLQLNKEGYLTLKKGYATDGPSGPTWDTTSSIRASFVHDGIYWLIRNGRIDKKYKEIGDKIFRDICIDDGMWKFRANWWYRALIGGGVHSTYPSNEKTILRAP